MAKSVKRSSGAFDVNMLLREDTDGSLTTTGTYAGVKISETPVGGLAIRAHVPAAASTTTLDLIIEAADSDVEASYAEIGRFETITAAGDYVMRVATQRDYLRLKVEVAGTTPDFGEVEVGPVIGGF